MTHVNAQAEEIDALNGLLRQAAPGEPLVVDREGKPWLAIISPAELERMEQLADLAEDRLDADEARKILAEIESGKSKTVPFADVCRELGLPTS